MRKCISVLLWLSMALLCVLRPTLAGTSRLHIGHNLTSSTFLRESNFAPPDAMGAVGPRHLVELINGRYAVYQKRDGRLLQTNSLDGFWANASVPFRGFTFDPRILYDPQSRRWFALSVDNARDDNQFLFAVSRTSDPTAGWIGMAIDSDSTDLHWADFPTLGMDRDAVYLAADMHPIPGRGNDFRTTVVVIPKQDLLRAIAPVVVIRQSGEVLTTTLRRSRQPVLPEDTVPVSTPTVLPRLGQSPHAAARHTSPGSRVRAILFENIDFAATGFSLQPMVNLDRSGSPTPLLSSFVSASGIFKASVIRGTATSPQLDTTGGLILVTPFFPTGSAAQPGPKLPLEVFGGSVFASNLVRQNNTLWGAHTVADGDRAAVRWFQIEAETLRLLQEGLIADEERSYYTGSIAVNASGQVVIGCNGSSAAQFVSSYAVLGETADGVTTFGPPVRLQAGASDYEVTLGTGRNRWGDYSATVQDPSDALAFWTFQEWVSDTDIWSTQITQLTITPRISAFLRLESLTTSYDPDDARAAAGVFTLTARLTNQASTHFFPAFFEVTTLTQGNTVLNADGGPDGVGARLALPTTLRAGTSSTVVLEIGLARAAAFDVRVEAFGTATKRPIRRLAVPSSVIHGGQDAVIFEKYMVGNHNTSTQ